MNATGTRALRLFGGRRTMLRPENGGRCDPENCPEYQARQCNLSGRFLFFIPGIRSICAFELHTNSFYAMNAAIQKFEMIAFMRGGRISGFLDRERTPFYLSKRSMEVAHIDEQGRAVRVPQWIIELEAPVDVTALLREDDDTVLAQAEVATQILEGRAPAPSVSPPTPAETAPISESVPPSTPPVLASDAASPSLEAVLAAAENAGIARARYEAYASRRWGMGWKLNPRGRRRAWDELERYRNDPTGYADKIAVELRDASGG